MNYAQAVTHLNGLMPELAGPAPGTRPPRFDLAHMLHLCAELGNPQDRFPSVLIAGTNGKGSTAATLASILTSAGYRTGLYTSPHLSRVNERIQLAHPTLPSEYGSTTGASGQPGSDGRLELAPIDDQAFAELYAEVDQAGNRLTQHGDLPQEPSFFERLTALAFLYFARQQAEFVVLEVGLGGRLDATNVVKPQLSILTDIALDHQAWLGKTLAEIAAEKCGILRQGGTLVTLSQHPEVNQAIGEAAARLDVHGVNAAEWLPGRVDPAAELPELVTVPSEQGTHLHRGPHYHPHQGAPQTRDGDQATTGVAVLSLGGVRYSLSLGGSPVLIRSPLAGEHQRRNLALAIASALTLRAQGFRIPDSAILQGIAETRWPGRLETLRPNLLLDVAHNPAGAWTLRSALARLPEAQPRTLIFSCLRDKDLREMTRILFPLFDSSGTDPLRRHDHIILAPIASPRAASVQDLLDAAHELSIPVHAAPHLQAALGQARQITPAGGLIIVTGSVYLVGELRDLAIAGGFQP